MTSNANGLAMGDAGSYRAAEDAMRMAGIDADSPVQFVGHSQGGMVAAGLIASGDYNAQGLFTVGGVVSQGLVTDSVPWLAIEHTDDLVPALGGTRTAPNAVLVRREALAGAPIPSDTLLPAHELTRYRETAALVDASEDGRTAAVLARLNQLGSGATAVTSSLFYARRVP
jgi:pimeloyl-ACP methyl ester carboxylesterase